MSRETTKQYRTTGSRGIPCGHPYYDGPAHTGHSKCIKMRRRIEANIRKRKAELYLEAQRKQEALDALVAKSTVEHRRVGKRKK